MVGTALAWCLRRAGHAVSTPGRSVFDISRMPIREDLIAGRKAVVNAAVVKNPDNPEAEAVNVDFPQALAKRCNDLGVPFIHLSTDAVFHEPGAPPDESTTAFSMGGYSGQKARGEPAGALVLRTSVIGPETREFSGLLCWILSQTAECDGYTDHLWNGLSSIELGRAIVRIIENGFEPGIRHLFTDTLNKAELLQMLVDTYGSNVTVRPVKTGRPRDQRLATLYQDDLNALCLRSLPEQVRELSMFSDGRGRWRAPQ